MRYYTIQNNNLLISDKRTSLARFYTNVYVLPLDYAPGKYIIDGSVLIYNENYELIKTAEALYLNEERKTIQIFDSEHNQIDKISS